MGGGSGEAESVVKAPIVHTVHTAPVLPQYHPTSIAAMLRAGKHLRVQRILGHVANCIRFVRDFPPTVVSRTCAR